MREICYSCPYAGEQRVSDITIGDFWGLAKDALNGYSGRVSLALSNTERGERFLNAARELFCVQERTVEEAVAGNDQLRAPTPRNARRATFERVYCATGDFRKAARACGVGRDIRHTRIRNKLFALPRFVKHRVLKK